MTKTYIKDGQIRTFAVENGKVLVTMNNVSNPTEEMFYEWGWREYVAPAPTPQQLLEEAKENKRGEIEAYDQSSAVCEFYVNGQPYWLTPAERGNYKSTLDDCIADGRSTIRWWGLNIPVEMAAVALRQINLYAFDTTNVTNEHILAVMALESVEAVEAYDYKVGYPEKKSFNISSL